MTSNHAMKTAALAASVFAITAGGAWLFTILSGPSEPSFDPLAYPEDLHPVAVEVAEQADADWASKPRFEALGPDRSGDSGSSSERLSDLAGRFESAIRDEYRLLDHRQRRALARAVVHEASIRGDETPDRYLATTAGGPYRLLSAVEAESSGIGPYYWYRVKQEFDPAKLEKAITEIWATFIEDGYQFASIGSDDAGISIDVKKVRDTSQRGNLWMSNEDRDYWYAAPRSMHMLNVRSPSVTIEETINKQGSAIEAEVNAIVRSENGLLMNWISFWHLTPSGDWVAGEMIGKFGREVYAFD